ncbi:MAG: hypothetical protein WKF87_16200 [Chryseolinea sp.]
MELELLKKSWDNLSERVVHLTTFNEKLVDRIIASRVMTTIDKINRLYKGFYVILAVEVIMLIAILLGNPFDFRYHIQYIPYGLLLPGVIIAFFNLRHIHTSILKLSPGNRIDEYLKSIGAIYERNKRFERWFGSTLLSIGLLVPFSFLPTKIDRVGTQSALIDTAIMVGINLVLFFAAFKLGAFKNKHRTRLEADLKEWRELKTLAEKVEG